MGITDKFLNFMRLNDDDDDYDYSDDYAEDEYEAPKKKTSRKSFDDDYSINDDVKPAPKQRAPKNKVVPMRSKSGLEVCIFKPANIEDGRDITNTLVSGRAVILNLEGIHVELAQRIIDFTSGSCFAINGNMQKISNYIFIATPPTVDISGEVQEIINGNASLSDF